MAHKDDLIAEDILAYLEAQENKQLFTRLKDAVGKLKFRRLFGVKVH